MILKEGSLPITLTAVTAVLVAGLLNPLASIPLWIILAWLLRVYWEHRPQRPAEPKGLLSPIRGRVRKVDTRFDPWLERSVQRVQIEIPFPGIVPLRSPSEAKVMDLYTRIGAYGSEQRACLADESPDCYAQWLRTDEDEDVVVAVSSKFPVSRARFEHAPGERVGQGARSGFIYFASRVDILIPNDAELLVAVGDKMETGQSIIARLPGH